MNRYRSNGPSKASATTVCQKCLKRGHYSYECTAAQQDRPYVSRPSRTQQLVNPKLAPKIKEPSLESNASRRNEDSETNTNDLRHSVKVNNSISRRSSKSISTGSSGSDSDSVSSISTNRSRSPRQHRDNASHDNRRDHGDFAGNAKLLRKRDSPDRSDKNEAERQYRQREDSRSQKRRRQRSRSESSDAPSDPGKSDRRRNPNRSQSPHVG